MLHLWYELSQKNENSIFPYVMYTSQHNLITGVNFQETYQLSY